MDILIESALEQVFTVLLGIFGAAVAAGGAVLIRWINRKTKNDTLADYASMLVFFAEKAVLAVAQSQADVLKDAANDGKLSDDEKAQMKAAAMDSLKAIAPEAILKFMKRADTDIDKLLDTLIESAVHEKNNGE